MTGSTQLTAVHYLPLGTTLIALIFCSLLLHRFVKGKRTPHLLWWTVGVACYGLGTFAESLITLTGNSVFLSKFWYITGALLGGYPLAQGSVYLLYSRRFANRLTAISLPFVILTSLLVILSPVVTELMQPHRPSGTFVAWKWLRLMTPFINTYAVIFLIGGAAVSSWRYFKQKHLSNLARGNAFIAFGAILPAIGGSLAKAGIVEALYVLEFLGLIFIWLGDRICSQPSSAM
jgi:hypothetical protein